MSKESSFKIEPNFIAFLFFSPTIILDGYKLSCSDFPSLRNSGEKNIFLFLLVFLTLSVNPIGTVDFITIEAVLFIFKMIIKITRAHP